MLRPHLFAVLACALLAHVGTHAARPGTMEHQHVHSPEEQQQEHAAMGGLAALTNPFHCIGNKNEEDCDAYTSECTWCNSTTVGTGCYPLKIAKILPAKYFNCDYDPNDETSSETSGSEGDPTDVAALEKKKHKKGGGDIAPTDCFSQKKKACKKADACEWCVSDTGMGSCFSADVAKFIPFCSKPSLSSDLSDSSASSSDSSDDDEDEAESDSSDDEDEDEGDEAVDRKHHKKHHKADCVSYNTSEACDDEDSCNWCATSGFGTGCYPKKVSDYLPESLFKCDKPSDACVKQGTKKDCISEDGCSWCTTGGLGTGCYPEKVADRLPKRFFTCEEGDDDDDEDSSSSSSESSASEGSSSSDSSASEGSSSSESSGSESSASEGSASEGSSSSESSSSEEENEGKKPSFIDCMNKNNALECDASDRCSWCKSTGLGTGCYPRKVSKILPHKVFECDKEPLQEEEEHEQKLGDAKCEKKSENECVSPSCVWCTSAAVGAACYSPEEAARLPSAVFSCKTAPSFTMPIA